MYVGEVRIKEITVQAQNKFWDSEAKLKGHSGETVVSWTLTPPREEDGWTPEEATSVTLLMRKELQRILIADAMTREVPPPR